MPQGRVAFPIVGARIRRPRSSWPSRQLSPFRHAASAAVVLGNDDAAAIGSSSTLAGSNRIPPAGSNGPWTR